MKKIIFSLLLATSLFSSNTVQEVSLVPDNAKKFSYSGFGKILGKKLVIINISSEQSLVGAFIDDQWADDYVCKNKVMKDTIKKFNADLLLIFKDKLKLYSKFSCIK